MKRIILYVLSLLLVVLTGCVKEIPMPRGEGELPPYPKEGKVEITMSVEVPSSPATKSMADLPDIDLIRVAVFGSSGFLKEVVDAENVSPALTNGNSILYTFKVHLSLTDSKNLRVNVFANCDVKLPWKYEGVVMCGSAYTTGNQDAYWARFILANGLALKTQNVLVTDPDTGISWYDTQYVKDGEYYQVTDEVTEAFNGGKKLDGTYNGLPLLRNFAKITVESTTPQLTLDANTTMTIINMPDRGSVAPYDPSQSLFLMDYKDHTYSELRATYDGFSPESMEFVNTDPDEPGIFRPCGKSNGSVTGGIYMFERPKPTGSGDVPTYIIIHGKYRALQTGKTLANWKDTSLPEAQRYPNDVDNWLVPASQAVDCYYKIDLMDNDGYYAVLRNFRYHLRITGVSKPGAATPGQAGSTGGSGDISTSAEAHGITDISNGYGRIAVDYVERTIVDQTDVITLKYKFIPDVEVGDASLDNRLVSEGGPVTITVGAKSSGSPINVIANTLHSSISSATGVQLGTNTGANATGIIKVMGTGNDSNDAEGYRTIKFTTNTPSNVDKALQTIHIEGKIDEFKKISRDVDYYLMEHQNMTVTCLADEPNPHFPEDEVESVTGQGVNVSVNIPIQLPESMFPLLFKIESTALSITPNTAKYPDDNLPVESGYSICTGKTDKKTFHYIYTLSYNDYKAIPQESTGGKTFTCHFKTNMDDSASTVYVSNEYFNLASDTFGNYTLYNFSNLAFSNYNAGASTNLNFTFRFDEDDTATSRTISVYLDGLVPQSTAANTGWSVSDAAAGEYTFTYSNTAGIGGRTVTLPVRTLGSNQHNGTYAVTLNAFNGSAPVYHEATLDNQSGPGIITVTETLSPSGNNNNSFGSRTWNSGIVRVSFASARKQSTGMQINDNNSFTVSTTSNKTIVSIIIHYYHNANTVTASPASYVESSDKLTGTWTGSATSVTLSYGYDNSSTYTTITGIEVTYEE